MLNNNKAELNGLEIAIVGMTGKFPDAENIDEYWQNLKNGKESISFFSDEELLEAGIDKELLENKNYVKAKGKLDKIDEFDADFFGFTPVEAELLDPQKRFFLECAWKALEDSGYKPDSGEKKVGLYAGSSKNLMWEGRAHYTKNATTLGGFATEQLASKDFTPLTVSYKLNLKGPSLSVQTACSTSLVAVDLACKALLTGQCDTALAGGVSINFQNKTGYLYQEGMVASPDGYCRAFDSKAKGTVTGEGVGVLVLKTLEDAIEQGDYIYAVIKGSATNNDGNRKVGYTAPSVQGQVEVIKSAINMAEVDIENISYIEAHGTGTVLGDPIEIEALKQVFGREKQKSCGIGSVKTNIGHLDAAAGIAGLIKVVLSIQNKMIPPSLHFHKPNPKIDIDNSPFYINATLNDWKNDHQLLTAGVSSFGIGGTNAHVIVQEAPLIERENSVKSKPELLLFSAKTESSLDRIKKDFASFFTVNKHLNLSDVAHTLQVGRKDFQYREKIVCNNIEDAINQLTAKPSEKNRRQTFSETKKKVVFMFPGQGSQYVNMGIDLYKNEKVFKDTLDECAKLAKEITGYNLISYLYPEYGDNNKDVNWAEELKLTSITQPLLLIFEYALAKLIMSWGLSPFAMIGHSIGEYVAATLAGVFSIEDAIKLVSLRGKLMGEIDSGSMLGVMKSESEIKEYLYGKQISIAAVNSPENCVISGADEVISEFENDFKNLNIHSVRLQTSHAFHSFMMDPVLELFKNEVEKTKINTPKIPYVSNVTGEWISEEELMNPAYWSDHIRNTVCFSKGIESILEYDNVLFLEIGPGKTLSSFANHHNSEKHKFSTVNLVRHPNENVSDIYYILNSIGNLWLNDIKIDFRKYNQDQKKYKIPLPTYSFERKSYWPKLLLNDIESQILASTIDSKNDEININNWLYVPNWKRTLNTLKSGEKDQLYWLVFANDNELNTQLVEELKNEKDEVIIIRSGGSFSKVNDFEYVVNCNDVNDYNLLFEKLDESDKQIGKIIHLWSVVESLDLNQKTQNVDIIGYAYYSLLNIANAFSKNNLERKTELIVVNNNTVEVLGGDLTNPQGAIVMGPVKVIPQEFSNISCRLIDIDNMSSDLLVTEICGKDITKNVAFRNGIRWEEGYMASNIKVTNDKNPKLKEDGTYLILGGTGGIGLAIAKYIASSVKAKIILLGRKQIPNIGENDRYERYNNLNENDKSIFRAIDEINALGSKVFLESADVSDFNKMNLIIDNIKTNVGEINGVFHCAGIADGGLISTRKREDSEKVFSSKLQGTIVIDRLFKENELDFVVFSSSLSSILGIFGQVAYCAANSFIDAFVLSKRNSQNTKYYSINWDVWNDVGMSVNHHNNKIPEYKIENIQKVNLDHPLLDSYEKREQEHIFKTLFNVVDYWVLKEHKIFGRYAIPGTALLELIHAAYEYIGQSEVMELKDIHFFEPLTIKDTLSKELKITFIRKEDSFEFNIECLANIEDFQGFIVAKGVVSENFSINEKDKYFNRKIEVEKTYCREDYENQFDSDRLGLRWNCFTKLEVGVKEVIKELQLSKEFTEDLCNYKLHPALLDVAVTIIGYEGGYLPFSYKSIKIYHPFTEKIFVYQKQDVENKSFKEFLLTDIVIFDENGRILVEIDQYCVKKVSQKAQNKIESNKQTDTRISKDLNSYSGVQILDAILKHSYSQVLVSIENLTELFEKRRHLKLSKLVENHADNTVDKNYTRPEIDTKFVPPGNKMEEKLADIVKNFFGFDKVGVNDDFFELGVDSLKGMQILLKIKNELSIDITLMDFFDNPNISKLSKFITGLIQKQDDKEYANEIII